jgi:6-phospho-beta-glucosidase
VQALGAGRLPPAAQGLLLQVKAYESRLVDAVVRGAREEVEVALALHPLVPGLTAARELISDYVDAHREMLAYLH